MQPGWAAPVGDAVPAAAAEDEQLLGEEGGAVEGHAILGGLRPDGRHRREGVLCATGQGSGGAAERAKRRGERGHQKDVDVTRGDLPTPRGATFAGKRRGTQASGSWAPWPREHVPAHACEFSSCLHAVELFERRLRQLLPVPGVAPNGRVQNLCESPQGAQTGSPTNAPPHKLQCRPAPGPVCCRCSCCWHAHAAARADKQVRA